MGQKRGEMMIKRVYRGFISLFLFFLSLLLLWLLGIKNLESRLKAGYQAQYFSGKVQVKSFIPDDKRNWASLEVSYIYTENVGSKVYTFPIKKNMSWLELILPTYKGEISYSNSSGMSVYSRNGMGDYGYEMYEPMLKKVFEEKEEYKVIERELAKKLQKSSELKGARISLKSTFSDNFIGSQSLHWLDESRLSNIQKGHSTFGGAEELSVKDAIANGLIYVSIDLPNNLSNNEKTEFLKKSLKELNDEESLPNGIYRLKGEEKGFAVEDGKLRLENW